MDSRERSEWVKARVDTLAPPAEWEPDSGLAGVRFQVRADAHLRQRSRRRRGLLVGAAAVLAACLVVAAVPQTSALAQDAGNRGWQRLEQLWYWFTIVRPGPVLAGRFADAVRALHTRPITFPSGPLAVASVAEAAAHAGFTPGLPTVLTGSPRLAVVGPRSFAAVIHTADLAAAVPPQWEGAQLTLQIGSTVTARWADGTGWSELTLAQAPATVTTAPAGLELEAIAAAGLRTAGMRNADMISRLSRHAATVPALLFGYLTPYRFVAIREVSLRSGPAALIEEFGLAPRENGFGYGDRVPRVERLSLLWSTPDRVYLLSGIPATPPGMLSGALAAALVNATGVANAIQ